MIGHCVGVSPKQPPDLVLRSPRPTPRHQEQSMRTTLYAIAVGALIGAMLTEIYLAAIR